MSNVRDEKSALSSSSTTMIPTSNQAFPHPPWQYAWKSPQFHTLPLQTTSTSNKSKDHRHSVVLDHAAARVRIPRDVPLDEDELNKAKPKQSAAASSSSSSPPSLVENEEYVLTVTLVAGHQGLGTDIRLEVWKQPQPSTSSESTSKPLDDTLQAPSATISLIASRDLQWPATSMMPDFGNNKSKTPSSKNTPSSSSNEHSTVVALGLARKPPPDALAEWTNALDVLHWLSLDRTAGLTSVQREWLTHLQQPKKPENDTTTNPLPPPPASDDDEEDEEEEMENTKGATSSSKSATANDTQDVGELLLFCLDTNAVLHVYQMANLWQRPPPQTNDGGMAALMLGLDLLAKVQACILPLTQPWHQVQLSWADSNRYFYSATRVVTKYAEPIFQMTQDGPSTAAFGRKFFRHQKHIPHSIVSVADVLCIAGRGMTKKEERNRTGQSASTADHHQETGFCTFLSLRTLEEVRTVYLPFVPLHLYPWQWHGWIFLLCVGSQGHACAIRVDAGTETTVPVGDAPSLFRRRGPAVASNNPDSAAAAAAAAAAEDEEAEPPGTGNTSAVPPVRPLLNISRFQIVPVVWPATSTRPTEDRKLLMVVGSAGIHCAVVYKDTAADEIQVVQYTFGALDTLPDDREDMVEIYGKYRPPNVGTPGLPVLVTRTETVVATLAPDHGSVTKKSCWCYTRRGWGLIGMGRDVFWIGWQGQRQAIAYCKHLATLPEDDFMPIVEEIQPFRHLPELPVTASPPNKGSPTPTSVSSHSTMKSPVETEKSPDVDNLIVDAMESISALSYRGSASPPASPLKRFRKALTQREKSQHLLRQCSSWTRLELAGDSSAQINCVQSVVSLRGKSAQYLLTLRQADILNTEEAPFDMVLSWLANHEDYFTASSLALDLLQDASSLRHLWESYGKIKPGRNNTDAMLEGLLEGVSPVIVDDRKKRKKKSTSLNDTTLTQLADMTISCLTKGGYLMSSTLEHFVLRDKHYSASRAALLLVATAAHTLSDDPDLVMLAMGKGYTKTSHEEIDHDATLWPVRALLNVGVARDMLGVVLLLLNATIPNTLRNRKDSDLASAAEPSLSLCKALVSLIVGSSPEAAECLLGLIDEQSRVLYWNSLSHETQLELALVSIREDSCPMLLQSPVRNWVLAQLQDCLATEGSASAYDVFERTPSSWLQELVMATLRNARCSLKDVRPAGKPSKEGESLLNFETFCRIVDSARGVILSSAGKFGVDFDVLIGALLVLERRDLEWCEGSHVPTQSLLNAVCHFAGRRSQKDTVSPLDAPTLMRQCFLAGNVEAGANLIGGFNGLVLKCCHVLVASTGMEIDDAEKFLLADDFPELPKTDSSSSFTAGEAHFKILWLLREHVLRVRQYGDFVASSARGRIDPIAAARVCLRSWWRITCASTESTSWLVRWFQEQLDMVDNQSRCRLACAALLRALIWPNKTAEQPLPSDPSTYTAAYLHVPNFFLSQLALSACGLVEAVPEEYLDWKAMRSLPTEPSMTRARMEERPVLSSQLSDLSVLSSESM